MQTTPASGTAGTPKKGCDLADVQGGLFEALRTTASSSPAPARATFEVSVESVGEVPVDAMRDFWHAFASIAADLLDEGDLLGDDLATEETAA
jgi:hypothetical protein